MNHRFVPSLLASLALAACSGESAPHSVPTVPSAADSGHGAHGERVALGAVAVGEHTFDVFQLGKIEAGAESDFDFDFPAGKSLPGTVRVWIGEESGKGSMKVRFAKETESRMHGHPEVPSPIPAGSRLWIEIESASGTSRASLAYRP